MVGGARKVKGRPESRDQTGAGSPRDFPLGPPEVVADSLPAGGANERSPPRPPPPLPPPRLRLHPSSCRLQRRNKEKGREGKIDSAVIQTDGVYFSSPFPSYLHASGCGCWRTGAPWGSQITLSAQFHQNTKLLPLFLSVQHIN